MATERIEIVVSERGARGVRRSIADIGQGAEQADRQLGLLRRGLTLLGGALAIDQLRRAADSYTNISNRIRLVTNDSEELAAVQAQLFQISQQTRSGFEDNANVYNRLALATKDLGVSQQDVLDLTKSLNQAMIISGVSAQEGAAGLLQLSQGLAAGALQADEFRSVNENIPKLMDIIAKSMGVARGELKKLAGEGKITASVVLNALREAAPELEREFANIRPTISQAFIVMQNAALNFIGSIDQANGISATFAETIIQLANNFDKVALAIAVVAGAAGLAFMVRTVATLSTAFALLGRVAVASLTTALGAVRALVTGFGLLRIAVLTNPLFIAGAAIVGSLVAAFFLFREEIESVINAFGGLRNIANRVIGFIVGGVNTIVEAWSLLPSALGDIAVQSANFLIEQFTRALNGLIFLLNKLPGVNIGESAIFQFENRFAGSAARVGEIAKQQFEQTYGKDFIAIAGKSFEEVQAMFARIANPGSTLDLSSRGVKGGSDRGLTPTLTAQQQSEFDSLLKKINPVLAAEKELAEATKLLDLAQRANLITAAEKTELMDQLNFQLRDQLNPLAAVNRELEKERNLLKLSTEQREIERRVLETVQALREAGVKVTKGMEAALRGEITALQQLNDIREREERLLKSIRGAAKDYKKDMEALENLYQRGEISIDEYTDAVRRLRIEFLETQKDAASGFERAFLKLEESVSDAATAAEDLLTGAFERAGDAVADFVETGKLDLESLVSDFARQLIKLGTQQLLVGGGNLLGFGKGATGGGFNFLNMFGGLFGGLGGLLGFQNGGEFTVGPNTSVANTPGIDNRLVAFRARDGETVTVNRPGERSGATVNIHVHGVTDADSFRRSEGQIYARAIAALQRANQRNN